MACTSNNETVNLDDNGEEWATCEENEVAVSETSLGHGVSQWLTNFDELTVDDVMGMKFQSESEAEEFYRAYARFHGFAIRKDDVGRDMAGKINMRVLVCNREGLRRNKRKGREERVRDLRPITRTKCQARMRVHYDICMEKWRVTAFEASHNHDLTDMRHVHLMPQYRSMSDADKAQAEMLHGHGVKPANIMGIMLGQAGGYAELGFVKKDLQNHIDHRWREKVEEGDANAAICYLEGKSAQESGDILNFRTSDDGKLQDMFWADGVSRLDYQCFGDVLAFDTTYKKNKYNKPLVIFSGCNHHRQTVIFGCALVDSETSETYKWVLKSFLEAMCWKEPQGVVTDGDGAMKDAVREVFPNVVHRLCAWHLHRNACDNIKNSKFLDEFKSAIYGDMSVQQFEQHWSNMVEKYGLSSNRWIAKTYSSREMWAHAYLRGRFFARLRTTSQCEGINSFIKKYVGRKHTLLDFIKDFDRAVKEYRNNELLADYKSMYTEPVLSTAMLKIEEQAGNIYTREMFYEVKEQIEATAGLKVNERAETSNMVLYTISRYEHPDVRYEVVYEKEQSYFRCVCALFEYLGIPCSHIFIAIMQEDIIELPKSLITRRWTKECKSDLIALTCNDDQVGEVNNVYRLAALAATSNRLCHLASKSVTSFKEIHQHLSKLIVQMELQVTRGEEASTGQSIGDPNVSKTKGKPKQRQKGIQRRRCSHCGRYGHNIRKCPNIVFVDDEKSIVDATTSPNITTVMNSGNAEAGTSIPPNQ